MKNINMLINHVLNGFKSILKEPKSCDICSCLKCEKNKTKQNKKSWFTVLFTCF